MAMELSQFQKQKLEYYFKFFENKILGPKNGIIFRDSDNNGLLEKIDLKGIMKDILNYTGWEENSNAAKGTQEVHEVFFEVLFEKAHKTKKENPSISLSEWLAMWENLIPGAMSMSNFPVWLRLLPKTLFKVIDRNDDDIIDEEELVQFYTEFVKLDISDAKEKGKRAMEEMTDKGVYPLDVELYEQIFANFLLGRTAVGPGKYIFGCFDLGIYKFKLVMPPAVEEDSKPPETSDGIIKVPRIKIQAIPH